MALMTKFQKGLHLLKNNRGEFWTRLKRYFVKPSAPRSGITRVNGIRFEIDLELDPGMQAMFRGEYERELTLLLEKLLKPGDTFIDVGANVGYITAYSLGLVGTRGAVHSFEPVPQYFQRLQQLQKLNPDYRLIVTPCALGSEPGRAEIAVTNLKNIGWNTMVKGFMPQETVKETISVPIRTLDEYLAGSGELKPAVIKIDTEGYEFPVLKGFQQSLRSLAVRPILIIEVAPGAFSLLNSSLSEFAGFFREMKYVPFNLSCTSPIDLERMDQTTDVIFLPKEREDEILARVR